MKKILLSVMALLPITHTLRTMEKPNSQKHQCSVACVKVCQAVKTNHSNLLINLKQRLEQHHIWGTAAGKPCTHIQTEGLEILFTEQESCVNPKPEKQTIKPQKSLEIQKQPQNYTDIDALLIELEKDLPVTPVLKQKSFKDYISEISTLVRRAGSETLSLLKEETAAAACNNLDATCRKLEEKNNMLPEILGAASAAEKNYTEFLRLGSLVAQAVESAKRLSTKEPFVQFQDDITHPFNSYRNEIELLQLTLTKK